MTRGASAKNSNSKPIVKHALRQQAKRRRKNTTIAAGNVAPLPRIILPSNQFNGNFYLKNNFDVSVNMFLNLSYYTVYVIHFNFIVCKNILTNTLPT